MPFLTLQILLIYFLLLLNPLCAQERSTESSGRNFEQTLQPLTSDSLKLNLEISMYGGPILFNDVTVDTTTQRIFNFSHKVLNRLVDRYTFLNIQWKETDSYSPSAWWHSLHTAVSNEIRFILRYFLRAFSKHPVLLTTARTEEIQAKELIIAALDICELFVRLKVNIERTWHRKSKPKLYSFVFIDEESELIYQYRINEIVKDFSIHQWFINMRMYEIYPRNLTMIELLDGAPDRI